MIFTSFLHDSTRITATEQGFSLTSVILLKERLSYGNTTIFFSSFCSGKMNLLMTSSSSSKASWACRTVTSSGSERTTHFKALYNSNKTSLRTCGRKAQWFDVNKYKGCLVFSSDWSVYFQPHAQMMKEVQLTGPTAQTVIFQLKTTQIPLF